MPPFDLSPAQFRTNRAAAREAIEPSCTLYCLPYAGGSAHAYRPLERYVSPGLRVQGIELPGRGRRTRETLLTSLDELADDAFAQLRGEVGRGRYALFGHSMGALLAYLGLLRIRRAELPLPEALFLSGCAAPGARREEIRHQLPRAEFVAMLETLGGLPPEILQHQDLIDYFEPILRADFQAVETWQPKRDEPLPVRFAALVGSQDSVGVGQVAAWSNGTTLPLALHEFPGDHFFINAHWREIAALVSATLGLASEAGSAGRPGLRRAMADVG